MMKKIHSAKYLLRTYSHFLTVKKKKIKNIKFFHIKLLSSFNDLILSSDLKIAVATAASCTPSCASSFILFLFIPPSTPI